MIQTDRASAATPAPRAPRAAWVDLAKGWCILLVVTMHSTLGVGLAMDDTGFLHALVAFAKPFRMPDFFVISGLFAAPALALPWRSYLDRRVLHFVYFYLLWLAIVLAVKSVDMQIATPARFAEFYLRALVEPFSQLWFIHILPIFFLVYRLVASNRALLAAALAVAAILHVVASATPSGGAYAMSSAWTGWTVSDNFALFFIFFLTGATFRGPIMAAAQWLQARPTMALAGLLAWCPLNVLAVGSGLADVPGLTFVFALAGTAAVMAASTLLAPLRAFGWLRHLGRHSLVVYLAFVIPMAVARSVLLWAWPSDAVGIVSAIVTATAIAAPLVLERLVAGTPLGFLFTRPGWARMDRAARPAPITTHRQPAGRAG